MKTALPLVSALTALFLFAIPALGAQPSKKDIENCGGQDVAAIIKGCTALITKSPKNPKAQILGLYNRGLAHFRNNDFAKALDDHNAALTIFDKNKLKDRNVEWNLYLNRGRTKYSQKDWRGSAADSEAATKVDPTNPMAYTNWAYALLELEEFEEARRQLDWALAVNADDPSARALRGLINFYLGRYRESLDDYDAALTLAPTMIWARSNRALHYWWNGDSATAMKDLDLVLMSDPRNVWARTMRARILTQKSEYAKARTEVQMALSYDPDFPVAHMVKGKINRWTGQPEAARQELLRSLELDGTLIESLTTLAEMAVDDKDFPGALAYYDKALAVVIKTDQDKMRRAAAEAARAKLVERIERPAKLAATCGNAKDAAAHEACTELLKTTADPKARLPLLLKRVAAGYDDAKIAADISEILNIEPNNLTALKMRADRRVVTGDYAGAVGDFDAILIGEPRNIDALAGRAYALRELGDARASTDIAALLAVDPGNITGRLLQLEETSRARAWSKLAEQATAFSLAQPDHDLAWAYRGEAKLQLGDADGALADATRAIELDTKHPLAHVVRGKLFTQQRRYSEAANAFSRALALRPQNAEILALRSAAYLDLGNAAFAKADAEAIVSAMPDNAEGRELRAKASFPKRRIGRRARRYRRYSAEQCQQ